MNGNTDPELVLFIEALKVPVQERAAFLARACIGNDNLRRTVEALLKAHDHLGDFLENPPTQEPGE